MLRSRSALLLLLAVSGAAALRLGATTARPALARGGAVLMKDELQTMPVGLDLLSEVQQTVASTAVVIYSTSECPVCAECKALFDELEQPYTAVELDQREDGEAVRATLLSLTQQATLPNVFVGGQHLRGNDIAQAAACSGRLSELLGEDVPAPMGCVVPTNIFDA